MVIGGGTLLSVSTTDFLRRRKKEDFLLTTWRGGGLGAGASFMKDCLRSFAGSREGFGFECDRFSAAAAAAASVPVPVVAVVVLVATEGVGAAEAGAGAEDSFLDDPKTRLKNPGRSLGVLFSAAGGGGGGKEGKAGLLKEMVGLGAGGSIESKAGGGFNAMSDSTFRITDKSRFSGRDFFFFGFGRDDDRVLLFEAIVAIDGWGFRVLTWSEGVGDWYLLGPAGTLGVGAASKESRRSDGVGD